MHIDHVSILVFVAVSYSLFPRTDLVHSDDAFFVRFWPRARLRFDLRRIGDAERARQALALTARVGRAQVLHEQSKLARATRVVAAGGDGTVSWAAVLLTNACAHLSVDPAPLCAMPLGTGNEVRATTVVRRRWQMRLSRSWER